MGVILNLFSVRFFFFGVIERNTLRMGKGTNFSYLTLCFERVFNVSSVHKKKQWIWHNCGNTTEATTLLQQFIKKKKNINSGAHPLGVYTYTAVLKI